MSANTGVARTGGAGAMGDVLGGRTEGDGAILNAQDIRAQGGLLVLDGNAQYKLSAGNGWEGGVNPASGVDACCRFMKTTCPTPLPSSAPTSPPSPSPTLLPSTTPTSVPTAPPTTPPSETPTSVPTAEPSGTPTGMPTPRPTYTRYPSPLPTTAALSPMPSIVPTPWPTT